MSILDTASEAAHIMPKYELIWLKTVGIQYSRTIHIWPLTLTGPGRKMVCSLRMLIEVVYIIYNIRKAQEYNKHGD